MEREETGSSVSMSLVPLPELPSDVLGCIRRAVLLLDGGNAQAWARLSLVCRAWRESLRGALCVSSCLPVLHQSRLPIVALAATLRAHKPGECPS